MFPGKVRNKECESSEVGAHFRTSQELSRIQMKSESRKFTAEMWPSWALKKICLQFMLMLVGHWRVLS